MNGGAGQDGPGFAAPETDAQIRASSTSNARRRPRACDSCWHRKIRCDEENGRCFNCQRYGQRCTVTRANGSLLVRGEEVPLQDSRAARPGPRKRQRLAQTTEVTAVARRVAQPHSPQAYSRPSGGDYPREPMPPTISDAARMSNPSSNLNASPSGNPSLNGNPSPSLQSSTSKNALSHPGVEGVVLIEPVENPQKCKYVGKTSTQVLAKSAEEFFKSDNVNLGVMEFYCPLLSHAEEVPMTIRPSQPPLVEKDLAMQCVDAFFDTVPRIFPFMNELQFRKSFDEFYRRGSLDELVNVCCIYLVIAIGARSLENSRKISSIHFSAAWAMYDAILGSPYLQSVQCLILMTIELTNQNKEGQAVFAIGTAIRIAQSLGLHRALSAHTEMIELRFVEKNHRLRSCIWWTCYCLDKKLSFEFGRLSIINDTDCDIDCIDVSTPELPGMGGDSGAPPAFLHMIQISRILSAIMSRLFSRTAEPNDEHNLLQQIEAVDKMLIDWKNGLPQAWTADPELIGADLGLQSVDSLVLHCTYYNALLIIHRAALFGKLPPSAKNHKNGRIASAEIVCLNAARSLAKCINVLTSTFASWLFLRWATPYCLNVVFTLYVGVMKDPSHWMSDADVGLMKSITRCFSSSSSHEIAVRPFQKLMHALQEGIELARSRQRLKLPLSRRDFQMESETDDPNGSAAPVYGGSSTSVEIVDEFMPTRSQGLNFDSDFQFQHFFDFGNGGEAADVFQLWPLDLQAASVDPFSHE